MFGLDSIIIGLCYTSQVMIGMIHTFLGYVTDIVFNLVTVIEAALTCQGEIIYVTC